MSKCPHRPGDSIAIPPDHFLPRPQTVRAASPFAANPRRCSSVAAPRASSQQPRAASPPGIDDSSPR
jgi:hypothetical protein